jgi:hypothetical protein
MASKVKWNGDKVIAQLEGTAQRAVKKGLLLIGNEVKDSMRRTPRMLYTRYKKRAGASRYRRGARKGRFIESRFHHPSPPGYPPAVDTGRLIGSVSWSTSWAGPTVGVTSGAASAIDGVTQPQSEGPHTFVGAVGSRVPYAALLEIGSVGGQLAARPAWRPAVYKLVPVLQTLFKGEV